MSSMNDSPSLLWREWDGSADGCDAINITVIDDHLIFIQDDLSAASGKLVRPEHQLCTMGEIRCSGERGFELKLIDLGLTYSRVICGRGSAIQSQIEEALFSQGGRIGYKSETDVAIVQRLSLLSIYIEGLFLRENANRLRREWVEEYNRSTGDFRRRLLRTVYRRSIRANSQAGIDTSFAFIDCELFKDMEDQSEAISSMVDIIIEEGEGMAYSPADLDRFLRDHYLS